MRLLERSRKSSPEVCALITMYKSIHHHQGPRTVAQRTKLQKGFNSSKQQNMPIAYGIYNTLKKEHSTKLRSPKRWKSWERCVLTVVFPATLLRHAEIGQLVILLTKKRDGRHKTRLVFNGRKTKSNCLSQFPRPRCLTTRWLPFETVWHYFRVSIC